MISHTIQEQVITALREAGDRTPICEIRPAKQGGVSNTARLAF